MTPTGARQGRRQAIGHLGVRLVLYEMLSGRRPFVGETTSDTMVAILSTEPDWNALLGPRRTPRAPLLSGASRRTRSVVCATSARRGTQSRRSTRHRRSHGIETALPARESLLSAGRVGARDTAAGRRCRGGVLHPAMDLCSPRKSRTSRTGPRPPASLPDGRMVTFIRGGPFFQNPRGRSSIMRQGPAERRSGSVWHERPEGQFAPISPTGPCVVRQTNRFAVRQRLHVDFSTDLPGVLEVGSAANECHHPPIRREAGGRGRVREVRDLRELQRSDRT